MRRAEVQNRSISVWFDWEEIITDLDPWELHDQGWLIVDGIQFALMARRQLLRLRGRPRRPWPPMIPEIFAGTRSLSWAQDVTIRMRRGS